MLTHPRSPEGRAAGNLATVEDAGIVVEVGVAIVDDAGDLLHAAPRTRDATTTTPHLTFFDQGQTARLHLMVLERLTT